MSRPSHDDASVPKEHGYEYAKEFYRDAEVAEDYDEHRRGTRVRQRRNRRKWAAIREGLSRTEGVERILDLPCGTGRFTGALAGLGHRVVGSDISVEMMRKAREDPEGRVEGVLGYVQADAERLGFADGAFDCVVSIRFLFHVDPETRVTILREFKRVSRRWLLLDYRHKYTWRWHKRWVMRRLGLDDRPFRRVSRRQLGRELRKAGLVNRGVIRVGTPGFSEKWIVVAEPNEPEAAESILAGTALEDVEVLGPLGQGARSIVLAARWKGKDAALKVYRPAAIEAHARRHSEPLAEYEHARNAAFHGAPGMAPFVAEPLGRVVTEAGQALLQERLEGSFYPEWVAGRDAAERAELYGKVRRMVETAHAAGLHDFDLHPRNVLVTEDATGEPWPRLFDFNAVPLHARTWNPIGILTRARLLGRTWRDRRRLKRFRRLARG